MRLFEFREGNSLTKRNSHLDTWRKSYNSSSGQRIPPEVPKRRNNRLLQKEKTNPGRGHGQILSSVGGRGEVPPVWLQGQILLLRWPFSSDAP